MKVFISSAVVIATLSACFSKESLSEVNRDTLIKVAIIDTGLNLNDSRFTNLCKDGHRNFTPNKQTGHLDIFDTTDVVGHGTHVAGLIQKYAGNRTGYCMIIYKFYDANASGKENLENEVTAIWEAVHDGASIINISAGGPDFNHDEYLAIQQNPQITFVVAAGNAHSNMDLPENHYYPASYLLENEIVVGSVDDKGERASSSNYGVAVTTTEVGENVWSFLNYPGGAGHMSGTSQATAIKTGKLVASRLSMCHIQRINKKRTNEGKRQ